MAYKKTYWIDHVVQRPKTYTETVNADGTKTFTDAPGSTIQQGVPMSATNFNNAEAALQHYAAAFDMYVTTTQAQLRTYEARIATLENQLGELVNG